MPSDNEVMVLIYETVQKQLNQIKDTRVVLQALANRVTELETSTKGMLERTSDISERLGVLEEAVAAFGGKAAMGLEHAAASENRIGTSVDALRRTVEGVTNPSITLVSRNHSEIKDAVREMGMMHKTVLDEFEQYELRLLKLENTIDQILHDRILTDDADKCGDDGEVGNDEE